MELSSDVWASDWFPRALGGFLARDDALRLTVCFSVAPSRGACLCRYLMALHGPLAPVSARDLALCAARDGDWAALAALQRRCAPASQRRRVRQRVRRLEDAVRAVEAASGAVVSHAMREAMRLQRNHPIRFPDSVLYSAARRGRLEEVAWLVDVVADFDPQLAVECAARGGHARAVQWLLDWIVARRDEDKRREDTDQTRLAPGGDQTRAFHCQIRLDDPLLGDVGVITWREDPRSLAYGYVEGHGLLPRHRELRWARGGYPLTDWAAARGDLALLQRLAEHPVGGESSYLSDNRLQLAASHGHLHVLQWCWRHNQNAVVPDLARVMAEAAKRGDLEMLEWVRRTVQDAAELGSLTAVFEAACASGHVQVVRWLFQHYLDERTRPRYVLMTTAGAGHLDVARYLHEEQDYAVVGSTVAQAVMHGNIEVARYLYDRCSAKLSDGEKAMLVPTAVKSGKLAVVKWLVEELGLWSDQAIENAAWVDRDEGVRVLQFLWERDEARLKDSLSRVDFVRLMMKGKTDVAEWIMKHVDESDTSPIAASAIVWFSALLQLCPDSTLRGTIKQASTRRDVDRPSQILTKKTLNVVLHYRPRFIRHIKRLPVWAAVNGDLEVLQKLEAIGHPHLLADPVLAAIIKRTRDPAPMIWILHRRSLSPKQIARVVRWAAQYCMLSVLQSLLETTKSDSLVYFVSMRNSVWHGGRHGHTEVLQLVQDHIERSQYGDNLSVSRVWDGIMDPAQSPSSFDKVPSRIRPSSRS